MNKPLLLCLVFIFLMIKANAQKINIDTTKTKLSDITKVADTSVYVPLKYRNIHKRSPVLACVLSLYLPGAGQVYNKQVLKGVLILSSMSVSLGAAAVYYGNNKPHPHDEVTATLLLPFFAAYVYSAIDAPFTASSLNKKYHLGKKQKEFTSLRFSPDMINTGAGNKLTAGVSLILR